LDGNEWRRRLWHIAPGLLPLALWVIPHVDPIPVWIIISVLLNTSCLVAAALWVGKTLQRPGEPNMVESTVGYAIPALTLALLFPGQIELAGTALAILAFGDGSATLAGLLFRGPKLPWNASKSWVGSAAFLAVSVPYATVIYWHEARPAVPFSLALTCAGSAALVAAVVESLPSRMNDNFRVGLSAALTLLFMQNYLVGWQ
jgi:dolichol kinase